MAGVRQISINFVGNATGLNQAASQGTAAVGRFSDRTQKMATKGLAAVGALGGGLALMIKGGVEGLQEGEEAESAFAQALGKAPKALQSQSDAIKTNAEAIQARTRFSYEDALATDAMLVANDGVQKGLKAGAFTMKDLTRTTLDLATVQGIDGAKAAGILGKAMAAPEKAAGLLRKAGVVLSAEQQKGIKAMVKNGQTADAQSLIYDVLREKVDGAADAAGDTTVGKLARANAAWGEVQESLATQVLPVVTKLVGWLLKITTWAQDNPGKVKAAVIVLGGLAVAIGTVSLAIKAWTIITKIHTAVMFALNVVMFANPVVLITVAIVALVAAVVLIATKTKWFQQAWSAAWGFIKKVGGAAIGWIVGKFGSIIDTVKALPGKILSFFKGSLTKLKQVGIDLITGFINGIVQKAKDIVGTIKEFITDKIPGFIKNAFGIFSPSRVMARLGRFVGIGFAEGIAGSKDAVAAATQMLVDGLQAKIDAVKSMAQGIKDAFTVDLSGGGAGQAGQQSFIKSLQAQATRAEQFTATIQRLRRQGLRGDLLEQLASGGPGNLDQARSIAPERIREINALAARVARAGTNLGNSESLARTGIDLTAPQVYVTLTLDGKELRAIAKAEIKKNDLATITAQQAGSKRIK